MPTLPPSHELREPLYNEVHARPYEPVTAPEEVSYVAVTGPANVRAAERRHLGELCSSYQLPPPPESANHYRADFGPLRLKWERHSEFSGYKFYRRVADNAPFSISALDLLPERWLARLPGELVVRAHIWVSSAETAPLDLKSIESYFAGDFLIGGGIAGGAGDAYTDLRLQADGAIRFLVVNREMGPHQAGRLVQRLLEIEIYRMMALLAFPFAQALGDRLTVIERELARVTVAVSSSEGEKDSDLLNELTRLAAEVESSVAAGSFRLSATRAYYAIVTQRISELREVRIPGVQTFAEFMSRRFSPAMSTCESVASRHEALSRRVARASELLRTRVEVTREQQNQKLLASLDQRQRLQLRLQATLEVFSIAAITYYVVGLVIYATKGIKAAGVDVDIDIVAGISIPVVAILVAIGVHRIRRMVSRQVPHDEGDWSP